MDNRHLFSAFCTRKKLDQDEEFESIIRRFGDSFDLGFFENKKVDIRPEDLEESEYILSTGALEEPSHHERTYVVLNHMENPEEDEEDFLHIHIYSESDYLDELLGVYNNLIEDNEEIVVANFTSDISLDFSLTDINVSGLNIEEVDLSGIRYGQDDRTVSIYQDEDHTIAREDYRPQKGMKMEDFEEFATSIMEEPEDRFEELEQ